MTHLRCAAALLRSRCHRCNIDARIAAPRHLGLRRLCQQVPAACHTQPSLDTQPVANHAQCMQAAHGRAFTDRHVASPHVPSRAWQAGVPRRLCACPAAPASAGAPPLGRRAAVPRPPSSVDEALLPASLHSWPLQRALGEPKTHQGAGGAGRTGSARPCWLRAARAVAVLRRAQTRPSAGKLGLAQAPLLWLAPGPSCEPVTRRAPNSEQVVPQAWPRRASPSAVGLAGTRERCMGREGARVRGARHSHRTIWRGLGLGTGSERWRRRSRLILVDALALLYRAHFGFGGARLATTGGEDTSAAYGLLGALLNLLELAPPPTHLAVVFDAAGKTFRRGPRLPARRGRLWAPGGAAARVMALWHGPVSRTEAPGGARQRDMRLAACWALSSQPLLARLTQAWARACTCVRLRRPEPLVRSGLCSACARGRARRRRRVQR
jgi:hypothetical protein